MLKSPAMLIPTGLAAIEIIEGAGLLIYPLGICSFALVFIICERTYALRTNAVMPQDLVDAIIENKPYSGGKHSVLARILDFAEIGANRHTEAWPHPVLRRAAADNCQRRNMVSLPGVGAGGHRAVTAVGGAA